MSKPLKKSAFETISPQHADSSPATNVERLYRNRFNEADMAAKDRVWHVVVRAFFQRWVDAESTVLDIGCGYGEFLNHIECARRIGVDCNSDSRHHLNDAIEFHEGLATDLSFLDDESVDVVFTSNVLEHMTDKAEVERVLTEARRVLRRDGHLIAMGPNIRFLGGSYWDFWDHHVAISDRSMDEVLRYVGYEILDLYPRFLPYTTRSRLPQFPFLVSLYLKCPPVWKLLGGQFLVRARKS